jgi:ATP-binding cassette, subfamily B, bacterial
MATRGWLARLIGYCWRYRRHMILAFGSAVVGMAVAALTPLIQRAIVDDAILSRDAPLAPLAALLIGAALVSYVTTFIRRYYGGRLSIDVQHQLRTEMFDALPAVPAAALRPG